ncbi:MAG: hypothetical protein JWO93_2991 [Micrococcaceae bacterium]|nr:hypothetical protein [Micrococcaceae bacterium]
MPDDGLPNHTQRLSLPGLPALVLQCLNQDRVVQVIDWHLVPLHFRGKRGGFDTEFFGLRGGDQCHALLVFLQSVKAGLSGADGFDA